MSVKITGNNNQALVSFKLTQDILYNYKCYPTLFRDKPSSCTICSEDFYIEDTISGGKDCLHFHHSSCLTKWILTSQNSGCPICKKLILVDENINSYKELIDISNSCITTQPNNILESNITTISNPVIQAIYTQKIIDYLNPIIIKKTLLSSKELISKCNLDLRFQKEIEEIQKISKTTIANLTQTIKQNSGDTDNDQTIKNFTQNIKNIEESSIQELKNKIKNLYDDSSSLQQKTLHITNQTESLSNNANIILENFTKKIQTKTGIDKKIAENFTKEIQNNKDTFQANIIKQCSKEITIQNEKQKITNIIKNVMDQFNAQIEITKEPFQKNVSKIQKEEDLATCLLITTATIISVIALIFIFKK